MVELATTVYKLVTQGASGTLTAVPAVYKLEINSNSTGAVAAENVSIADVGEYYTSNNVEGALQEVGASLSNIDGRLATAEGEIDTLQNDVANIVQPQSGQAIEVSPTGEVNLGSASNVQNFNQTRYIRGDFELNFVSDDGERIINILPESGLFGMQGVDILANSRARFLRFSTVRQTLTAVAGAIAWDMANGQSAVAWTIAWDMANGQSAVVTLNANATLSNPTNLPSTSETIYPDLEVIQGAGGGFVLTFGTNFVLPATYVAPPTAAGSRALYHFHQRSDGKLAVNYTYYTS